MNQYSIEKACINYVSAIVEFLKTSFLAAYPHEYQTDDIETYFTQNYTPEKITTWLESATTTVLLACDSNKLVGILIYHQKNSPVQVDISAIEIDKLYLLPHMHGTGLALKLLDTISTYHPDIHLQWLIVAEPNTRAQRFYKKHSFTIVGAGPTLQVGQAEIASYITHKKL